jgi:hypothetical protein
MALKVRRGSNAERQQIVFEQGELVYTTDTKKLYVGDGINQGGFPVTGDPFLGLTELVEDLTPQLGGNLDLNGKTIFGNGGLTISGNATIEELSILNFATNLIPKLSNAYSIGNTQKRIKNIYTHNLNIDGELHAEVVNADIYGDDSTLLINTATSTILTTALSQSGATDGQALVWNALNGQWQPGTVSGGGGGGGILNVVEDTSPELGGDLDINGNDIFGTGNIRTDGTYTISNLLDHTINFSGNGTVANSGRGIAFNSRAAISNYGTADTTIRINDAFLFTETAITGDLLVSQGNIKGNILAADDTLLVDSTNGLIPGSVIDGQVDSDIKGSIISVKTDAVILDTDTFDNIPVYLGNVTGDVTGDVVGNVEGNVLKPDTTAIVDSINQIVNLNGTTFEEDQISATTNFAIRTGQNTSLDVYSDIGLTLFSEGDGTLGGESAKFRNRVVKGSFDTPGAFTYGEVFPFIQAQIQDGSQTWETAINVLGSIDNNTGDITQPGKVSIAVKAADSADIPNQTVGFIDFSFNSRGVLQAPAFKATPYADTAARDAAHPTPTAGMILFNTQTQKFQGYVDDTGLAGGGASNSTPGWVDLN